jgi:hypothetical protein
MLRSQRASAFGARYGEKGGLGTIAGAVGRKVKLPEKLYCSKCPLRLIPAS